MMPAPDAMTDSKTEQAALDYLDRGWSVIPIHEKAKRPAVPWKVYQKRHARKKTVHGWFRRFPNYNVGIVTGELSGLVVVDVDPRHDGDKRLHRCAAVDTSVGQALPLGTRPRSRAGQHCANAGLAAWND